MPDPCPQLSTQQMQVGSLGLTNLTNDQSLYDLLIELDGLLGTLKATLGEGDVTTFHILNKTILAEDIADGVITADLLAPGVIPSGLSDTQSTLPVGAIIPYAGATAPSGWLLCDGTSYDAANHPILSALCKTGSACVFGEAAVGYFKVPDLRGRSPMGQGHGSGLTPRTLGDITGEEMHLLTEAEMPRHAHSTEFWWDLNPGQIPRAPLMGSHAGDGTRQWYGSTTHRGGNQSHNTIGPRLVLAYIIKDDPPLPGDTNFLYPNEGDTGVSVTVTMIWEHATNSDSYELQISTTSGDYSSPVYTATPSKTQQAIPSGELAALTTHYARVRAINTTGNGEWSTELSFTTA